MKYRNLKISFSIEGVRFTVLSISLDKLVVPIPLHSHSRNSYELHYVSYGYGTLIADGTTYEVVPGTFFMTGPGVLHEQISKEDNPMTEYGIYLQVSASASVLKNSGEVLNEFLSRLFWIGEADATLHELMKQIVYETEHRPLGNELMLPALLQQVIPTVVRQYHRSEQSEENAPSSGFVMPTDQTYLTIEEAFLYNYRDLTLTDLAAELNLGIRQTERLLQKHYRQTFSQKKTEARMSAACLLLKDRRRSIASVSEKLGYSSPEHFANAFTKYFHQTPSAYRKNLMKDTAE